MCEYTDAKDILIQQIDEVGDDKTPYAAACFLRRQMSDNLPEWSRSGYAYKGAELCERLLRFVETQETHWKTLYGGLTQLADTYRQAQQEFMCSTN